MDFLYHLIITISSAIPLALGYSFVFGRGKIMHYGPIGVAIVTVYAMFLTREATGHYVPALFAGIAAASLCSLLFGWLSLRLEADAFGILSIATHLMLVNIILNWQGVTHGSLGIVRIPRLPFMQTLPAFAVTAGIVCVLWIAFFLWLHRTSLARQLSALAEQEWQAKSLGIQKIRVQLLSLLILGFTVVSMTFFDPQYYHLVYPTDYMFPSFIVLLMWVVAGRPGSVWGAVIATTLLKLLAEFIRFVPLSSEILGPMRLLLFGVILLSAVWYRRDSLFPKKRTI